MRSPFSGRGKDVNRGFLLVTVFFLFPLVAGAESLRLATWNVKNYLLQNRWEEGRYRFNYPKPEREKAALHEQLLATRPDVLLLQELGSREMLAELQEDLASAGLDYTWTHFSSLPGARTGLAVLSNLPVAELLHLDPQGVGTDTGSLVKRGIQEILFNLDGHRLRIFHVHLKSRYTSDKSDPASLTFRKSELGALNQIIAQCLELNRIDEILLVAGDFNTPFDSPFLQSFRELVDPLCVQDGNGELWTYHFRKEDNFEQLDGFWIPSEHLKAFTPVGLFPDDPGDDHGSDHRLVIIDFSWEAAG